MTIIYKRDLVHLHVEQFSIECPKTKLNCQSQMLTGETFLASFRLGKTPGGTQQSFMHQSEASPRGPPPGTLGDLSKYPIKPHQIPLGMGQRNSDKSSPPEG